MQKYTKVPADTFEKLQLNAGILVDDFTPSTGVIGNILGATTGGINFTSNPTYTDFGEDIDNVPNNTMELKHLNSFDPTMSGTFLTCSPSLAKSLIGSADIDLEDTSKVVPRSVLLTEDFDDVWWIGDYSDVNTGDDAGFLAIHLLNALNTAGFQIQSTKDEKGQLAFEYHGHYSIEDQDTVPFEVYVKAGENELEELTVTSAEGATSGKSKITVSGYTLGGNESYVYQTAASNAPTVDYGDDVSAWTALTNGADITPTNTHTKITVAVKNGSGKAVAAGSATLTIKA